MLQQRQGLSTGLASSVSSSETATLTQSWKATQTRTMHKARHTWRDTQRRNAAKRHRTAKSRALNPPATKLKHSPDEAVCRRLPCFTSLLTPGTFQIRNMRDVNSPVFLSNRGAAARGPHDAVTGVAILRGAVERGRCNRDTALPTACVTAATRLCCNTLGSLSPAAALTSSMGRRLMPSRARTFGDSGCALRTLSPPPQ